MEEVHFTKGNGVPTPIDVPYRTCGRILTLVRFSAGLILCFMYRISIAAASQMLSGSMGNIMPK